MIYLCRKSQNHANNNRRRAGARRMGTGHTRSTTAALDNAQIVYLRTRTHPTADHLPAHLDVRTFDYLYEQESRFEEIYRQIAEEPYRRSNQTGRTRHLLRPRPPFHR